MKIAVRIPNWIGDAVLSVPFIYQLRKKFSDSKIYLVGRAAPLNVFLNFPYIEDLIEINDKKNGIFKTGFSLRKYKFDIMYLLPDSLSSALIGFLSGSKKLYGYRKEGRGMFLSKSLRPPHNIHRSLKYLHLLMGTEHNFINLKLIYLSDDEINSADRILNKFIDKNKKIIGLNPNSSAESRRWPSENFSKLGDLLSKDYNVIFFGSQAEINYVNMIIENMKFHNKIINLAGKISLREYIAVLSKLDLFITNDSGPMHLANAVNTAVIALEGPADIKETGVINKAGYIKYINKGLQCSPCVKNVCPYKHNNCMKLIKVEEVLKEIHNFFD